MRVEIFHFITVHVCCCIKALWEEKIAAFMQPGSHESEEYVWCVCEEGIYVLKTRDAYNLYIFSTP